MRLVSAVCAALALALLCPLAALAQSAPPPPAVSVPRLINISGVFQPADGQPPGPVEVVTLSIYAQPEGDLPLWQEMQTVTPDPAGRFTVLLGASQPEGLPPAVFASGEARWMGMLFARAGEVERPRVRITSVPYALKASDAETLGGRPASAYLLAPTAEGEAGSKGRAGKADDAAAAKAEPPATADLVLAGTTNFLAKYVNAADVGSSGVFENAAGAVGLGTNLPADRLHVRFTNTGGTATGLAVQNLGNTSASYSGMLFYDQNGALAQFQGFNNVSHEYRINNIASTPSINFMTASASRFFVASTGNIGIGTTAPSQRLDVSNALAGGALTGNIHASSFSNNSFGSFIVARKARGTEAAPAAVQNGDELAFIGGRGYGTTSFGQRTGGMFVRAAQNWTDAAQGTAINFVTTPTGTVAPVLQMTLDPSGNLGIGTTAPSATVEAVREGAFGAIVAASSFGLGGTNAGSWFVARSARGTAAAPAAVQDGDPLGFFVGNGYGTSGFADEFAGGMVVLAAEDWTDAAQGAVTVLLATPLGSTEAQAYLGILPNGNVGIGTFTETPTITDKLQVFGDIRVGTSGTNGCVKNFNGDPLAGSCVSDRRYKKDITPFGPALGSLTALQPVHYFWRAAEFPSQNFGDGRSYGLIAQEVEQVLPDLVVTGADGFKAVDYSKLPLLTIQAVKELKAENDVLKRRVDENEALKHRVAELERAVAEILATSARR